MVGRFEAGAGEGSLLMHTWAKVCGWANRKQLLSRQKYFLDGSHPQFASFYARAPPSAPESMGSRFEKPQRVCRRSERRSGSSWHQTTSFLKSFPGPFPGPWRASRSSDRSCVRKGDRLLCPRLQGMYPRYAGVRGQSGLSPSSAKVRERRRHSL